MDEQPPPQAKHKIEWMAPERLRLDPHNPRLASYQEDAGPATSDTSLVRLLWREMAVEELVLSISANGYLAGEPLLAIPPEEPEDDRLIVVEGNRRLAAVMLLCDPGLRERLGVQAPSDWSAEKAAAKLAQVPVIRYHNRSETWAVCGSRHINGPVRWESIDKASFIAAVMEREGLSAREVALRLGDTFNTVHRMSLGYRVLQQAEREGLWYRTDQHRGRQFKFSHLYTAVAQPEFQQFLGLDPTDVSTAPVPAERRNELRELLLWLFGSKEQNIPAAVVRQNPNLNELREVVAHEQALSALRSHGNLARALERTKTETTRLAEALARASEQLQVANGVVRIGFDLGPGLLQTAKDCYRLAEGVLEEMERSIRRAETERR